MRAKTVNFQRGLDPKKAMGIGDPVLAIKNKIRIEVKKLAEKFNVKKIDEWEDEFYFSCSFIHGKFRYALGYYLEDLHERNTGEYESNISKKNKITFIRKKISVNINDCISMLEKWLNNYFKRLLLLGNKSVVESVNFKRGLDPKDAMNTGDVFGRTTKRLRRVLEKITKERNIKITIDSNPTYFSGMFKYKNYCNYYIGIDPDSEDGIYFVGFENLNKPAGDETYFGTLKDAVAKLNSWLDWVDENIDYDGNELNESENDNCRWIDVEDDGPNIHIVHKQQIAEDDYDIIENEWIDPYYIELYLGMSFGLSIADIDNEVVNIDIQNIKKIDEEKWLFMTNYGNKELTLSNLQDLADKSRNR